MDLSNFVKIIFKDKKNYQNLDDKDKEKFFFIFNRMMARATPVNADALNKRGIDLSLASDIWFDYCQSLIDTPNWFWSRAKKNKEEKIDILEGLTDQEKRILKTHYTEDIKKEEEKLNTDTITVKKVKGKKPKK